ncbi:GntR family transcriptional regulator [cf. Phormidesmis sp. LEGE 11477]|uniref:GntR family transcriptional regulator n=1 Tax=cf. Phormidesmis sp. LEGE 11477 TaxID=1828680 RepID=UPI001880A967|nr:GntR family transcriptional regulator [cf. Phormidesmis sp. LEGE 11477]MBE9059593.1 GntR family transcriptional regulator [cf. Phormidesmis sp. LEGE 11477]
MPLPSAIKRPLHVVISEKLKQQIDAGRYVPGDRLPSEFDLGSLFEVSRTTVRHAIANLIQQGIVTTQQGKGIFVCDRQKISFSMSNPLMHFDIALQQQGYAASIKSLQYQLVPAPPEIALQLQLNKANPRVYRQEKIIYANESAIALEIDYFPQKLGQQLAEPLQQGFTYSTLTNHGILLQAAKVSLESIPTTYELSEYLEAPLGMPILVFNYLAYTDKRQPAICGKTLSRSDWTCYTSEFEMS